MNKIKKKIFYLNILNELQNKVPNLIDISEKINKHGLPKIASLFLIHFH